MTRTTKRQKRALVLAAAVAGLGLWMGQASAVTQTWDPNDDEGATGGSGNWSTTDLKWADGTAGNSGSLAWTQGNDAVFGGTGGGPWTVTLQENISAGSLTINTAGYTIASNTTQTLTLSAGLTANAAATVGSDITASAIQTWSVTNAGDTLTVTGAVGCGGNQLTLAGAGNHDIQGVFTGTGGLIKMGTGTATISNTSSTLSGAVDIQAGKLSVATVNMLGNATLKLGSAGALGTLAYTGATASFSQNVTLGGFGNNRIDVTSASAELTLSGTLDDGVSNVGLRKVGSGTLYLTGTNTFGSNSVINIDAGTIRIDAESGLGAVTNDVAFGGGKLQISTAGWTANAGKTFTVAAGSTGEIIVDSSLVLTLGTATQLITADTAGILTKSGTGELRLTNNNTTFDGTLKIDTGTVNVQGNFGSAIGDTTNRATVRLNGGTLAMTDDSGRTIQPNLTVTAASTIVSNRATAGAGVTHATGGTMTLNGFKLTVDKGTNVTSGTGAFSVTGSTTLTAASEIEVLTGAAFYPKALTGGFQLTKSGAGRIVADTAANANFNVGTIINAGIVEVTNATALGTVATVPVTVNSGILINNIGTIANNLTLAGGTLASKGGDRTFSGTVAVNADTIFSLSNPDALATVQSITLSNAVSGSNKITVTKDPSGGTGKTFSITAASTFSGDIEMQAAGNTASFDFTMNNAGQDFVATAGTLNVGGNTAGRVITANANVTASGGATIQLLGRNAAAGVGTTVAATAVLSATGGATINIGNNADNNNGVSLVAGATLTADNGTIAIRPRNGTLTVSGLNLTVQNGGTLANGSTGNQLTLNQDVTHSGAWTLSSTGSQLFLINSGVISNTTDLTLRASGTGTVRYDVNSATFGTTGTNIELGLAGGTVDINAAAVGRTFNYEAGYNPSGFGTLGSSAANQTHVIAAGGTTFTATDGGTTAQTLTLVGLINQTSGAINMAIGDNDTFRLNTGTVDLSTTSATVSALAQTGANLAKWGLAAGTVTINKSQLAAATANTLQLQSSGGTLTVNGLADYTGGVLAPVGINNAGGTILTNQATFTLASGQQIQGTGTVFNNATTIDIQAGAIVDMNGTLGAVIGAGSDGTLKIDAAETLTLTGGGTITNSLANTLDVQFNGATATLTVGGGTLDIQKIAAGGANNFTGTSTVAQRVLRTTGGIMRLQVADPATVQIGAANALIVDRTDDAVANTTQVAVLNLAGGTFQPYGSAVTATVNPGGLLGGGAIGNGVFDCTDGTPANGAFINSGTVTTSATLEIKAGAISGDGVWTLTANTLRLTGQWTTATGGTGPVTISGATLALGGPGANVTGQLSIPTGTLRIEKAPGVAAYTSTGSFTAATTGNATITYNGVDGVYTVGDNINTGDDAADARDLILQSGGMAKELRLTGTIANAGGANNRIVVSNPAGHNVSATATRVYLTGNNSGLSSTRVPSVDGGVAILGHVNALGPAVTRNMTARFGNIVVGTTGAHITNNGSQVSLANGITWDRDITNGQDFNDDKGLGAAGTGGKFAGIINGGENNMIVVESGSTLTLAGDTDGYTPLANGVLGTPQLYGVVDVRSTIDKDGNARNPYTGAILSGTVNRTVNDWVTNPANTANTHAWRKVGPGTLVFEAGFDTAAYGPIGDNVSGPTRVTGMYGLQGASILASKIVAPGGLNTLDGVVDVQTTGDLLGYINLADTTGGAETKLLVSVTRTLAEGISVSNASRTIYGVVYGGTAKGTLEVPTGITLTHTGTLAINNAGTLTKTGAGTYNINGAQTHQAGAVLTVSTGTVNMNTNAGGATPAQNLTINADSTTNFGSSQHLAALNVGAAATATLQADGSRIIVTNSLTIAGGATPTGTLDLVDNDMIIRTSGGADLIAKYNLALAQIKSGYENGGSNDWLGLGIQSTAANANTDTALGIIINDYGGLPLHTTWGGESVGVNDILIKYTWWGDANLDGVVNDTTDYDLWAEGLAGGSPGGWLYGDFDYDGSINDTIDYDLWAQGLAAYGSGGPLSAGVSGMASVAGASAVPEPATLSLLALGALGLLRRRNRR